MNKLHARLLVAALTCTAAGTYATHLFAAEATAPAATAPAAAPAPPPAVPYVMPASTPAYIRAAIESADRNAETRARDTNRKPAELLMLSGIKPGDRVVEFASFGQYFTALLSDIVGPKGRVYMLDLPYTAARAGAPSGAFVDKHANTQYTLVNYNSVELPANVDAVLNVLYYHDLPLNDIDTAVLNAKIFKALKPGGVFFVVDHNAEAGSGSRDTKKLHRIDPAVIRQQVTAAGFKLETESKLLAYASDDHTQLVFAPGLRGMTDQTVFVFRKPKK
jgi:predicted methyltransferase